MIRPRGRRLDVEALARRLDAPLPEVGASPGGPGGDDPLEALAGLAAELRELGADAPALADPRALRRRALAAPARRAGWIARPAAAALVALALAVGLTSPGWGPPVGVLVAPIVEWLDRLPQPAGPPDDPPMGSSPSPVPPVQPSEGAPLEPPAAPPGEVPPAARPTGVPGPAAPEPGVPSPAPLPPSPPPSVPPTPPSHAPGPPTDPPAPPVATPVIPSPPPGGGPPEETPPAGGAPSQVPGAP